MPGVEEGKELRVLKCQGLLDEDINGLLHIQGCRQIFAGHSPNWRVLQNVHSPSQKRTGPKIDKGSVREGKAPWKAG
jgi:hypothetical protein